MGFPVPSFAETGRSMTNCCARAVTAGTFLQEHARRTAPVAKLTDFVSVWLTATEMAFWIEFGSLASAEVAEEKTARFEAEAAPRAVVSCRLKDSADPRIHLNGYSFAHPPEERQEE
jgi:hypothetical protein